MPNAFLDAFYSLGSSLNKRKGKSNIENEEGVVNDKYPELALEMDNSDLSKLTMKWEEKWKQSEVYATWVQQSTENENYWKGNHFQKPEIDKNRPLVDNAIFESLETYLPQVTRRNPEPMVEVFPGDESDQRKQEYVKSLKKKLGFIADELNLRLKLKKGARHWAIYVVGVGKLGWDINKDIPTAKIVRPHKIILDPEATIDEDGYTGNYIGEHRKLSANILLKMLESLGGEKGAEEIIKKLVAEDLGTEIGFIEWWTNEYICWTLGKDVLLKKKNPHWNYDQEEVLPADPMTGQVPMDENGKPMTQTKPGVNHFPIPKMPYVFLSVFNLGKQPFDDTTLIGQNLSNQDEINKLNKQIVFNVDSQNNGLVISGANSGLTKDQAAEAASALRKGKTIYIPAGNPQEAVYRDRAPSLSADVFNYLQDTRNRLKDIFGTRGTTPSGVQSERTVRGKIINKTFDADRIGGGVSEYLEQFADEIYNWFVQLLYVYDDEFAVFPDKPRVVISVKEGSLLPKDSTTLANQATELAAAGKMSTIDLYKQLDYPNPEELAANVWLEANAPEILYQNDQRIQQAIQMKQQAASAAAAGEQKPPSMSMSFKDLPPEGQAQMAKMAGIDLHPEAIAAYDDNQRMQDQSTAANTLPDNLTQQNMQ